MALREMSDRCRSLVHMFDEVRICGLGSIDEAVLELAPGLTVLSGETGAGKSSIVRAFALLAGGRADVAHLRSGHAGAAVEGRLTVDPAGVLSARVRECGGELDGSSLLVTRLVSADGRSRAFVGGRGVPVGVLAEIVGGVLALHGQSSQLQLRHADAQRAALDRFAGPPVLEPIEAYHAVRDRWISARRAQAELQEREGERAREAELLRLGLGEVERVAPIAGEDLDLERELGRLGAADELRCASEAARSALAGGPDDGGSDDGGAIAAMTAAARALDAASANDPELGALAARAHEMLVLSGELAADLASYAAGVDDDPLRLSVAQERRAELTRLCRPHGTGVDGVLRWAADAEHRLADLEAGGGRTGELAAIEQAAAEEMLALAEQISAARQAAARTLQRQVTAELAALSMSAARLVVRVETASRSPESPGNDEVSRRELQRSASAAAARLGVDGADEVELLFASGEGLPLRPLARTASGGELSRVVLALEVVLAAGLGPASMVFDEVDAGIGGEAALEVGRRLAVLARSKQVICVTHLPQVAAYADRHLLVDKTGRGAAVHSGVQVLDQPGRVRELSRMLAGVSDSELARGHAAELLATAASVTEGGRRPRPSPQRSAKKRRLPAGPMSLAEERAGRPRSERRHPVSAGAP